MTRATKGRDRNRRIVVSMIAMALVAILVLALGVLKATPNGPSRHATTLDAVGWMLSTVESTGEVGESNSLAVDSNNHVHISYYDGTNGDLKYATDAGAIPEFGTPCLVMIAMATICIFVALRRTMVPTRK